MLSVGLFVSRLKMSLTKSAKNTKNCINSNANPESKTISK